MKKFNFFLILTFCLSLSGMYFLFQSCEKDKNQIKNVQGIAQTGKTNFKYFNNNYRDCAISVKSLSRFEWTWFTDSINSFMFVSDKGDTILWQNCNISNCEGIHVPPPLTLMINVTNKIQNNSIV